MFEGRALLEPRSARSPAARATPTDIARLQSLIALERAALREGDRAGRYGCRASFTSKSPGSRIRTLSAALSPSWRRGPR